MKFTKLLRTYILIMPFVVLSGCSSAPNKVYGLKSSKFTESNSATILFRTTTKDDWDNLKGISVEFTNLISGLAISSTGGPSIYADETYHALKVPQGTYELTKVAFYNGSMKPRTEGFKFNVVNGETVYIGSIKKRWPGENALLSYYPTVSEKKYFRSELYGNEVFGFVKLVDDSEDSISHFKSKFPSLKSKEIIVRLMQ